MHMFVFRFFLARTFSISIALINGIFLKKFSYLGLSLFFINISFFLSFEDLVGWGVE